MELLAAIRWNPKPFGVYHFLWIILTAAVCVLLCKLFASKHDDDTDERVIFSIGLILAFGEIFKQIYLTVQTGYYNWGEFPYQFCSTSMFVAFLIPFVKNKKIKEGMYVFLGFFGLLAGVSAMIETSGIFNKAYLPIMIHSTLWHSSMVILGVYAIVARGYGRKFRELIKGVLVYIASVVFAIVLNEVFYYTIFSKGESPRGNHCNLFFISSHYNSSLVVFKDIQPRVPYPIYILIYILAFCIGASAIWGIVKLIRLIIEGAKKKKAYS